MPVPPTSFSDNPVYAGPGVNTPGTDTGRDQALWASAFQRADMCLAISDISASRFIAVNAAYAARHGYSADELRGTPVSVIIAPEDTAKLAAFHESIRRNGQGVLETTHVCKDGTPFPARTEANLVRNQAGYADMLIVSLYDMTEQRNAEARLRQAGLVFDKTSEGIILSDAPGTITTANDAFGQLAGVQPEDARGRHLSDWLIRDDGLLPHDNTDWRGECWIRHSSGLVTPVLAHSSVVYNDMEHQHIRITTITDITGQKRAEAEIIHNANYDTLTGLPNRRLFLDRLEQEVLRTRRGQYASALLFLDIDNFKTINDTLGHAAGDQLLIEAAHRIRTSVRDYDTVARLGDDEFTIILTDFGSRRIVERVAADILQALAHPYTIECTELFLSASIGIAIFPSDAQEATDIIKCADQAMYEAKNAGRRCCRFFTRQMQEALSFRARLSQAMRPALIKNQFTVHYQPIVDIASSKIVKAEALLRWSHPEFGDISPAIFIPIAEEAGIIGELGAFVLQQTITSLRQWQSGPGAPLQISLNLSPSQLRDQGQWTQLYQHLEHDTHLSDMLVLEITEGLLLRDDANVQGNLDALRQSGFRIALDDFGTGYSSLSYLNKFDIDFLKIDKSFVDNLIGSASDRILCDVIITMAHKLGLKVIAEGIETENQRQLLQELGCDYGQGFLFSPALPWNQFREKYAA